MQYRRGPATVTGFQPHCRMACERRFTQPPAAARRHWCDKNREDGVDDAWSQENCLCRQSSQSCAGPDRLKSGRDSTQPAVDREKVTRAAVDVRAHGQQRPLRALSARSSNTGRRTAQQQENRLNRRSRQPAPRRKIRPVVKVREGRFRVEGTANNDSTETQRGNGGHRECPLVTIPDPLRSAQAVGVVRSIRLFQCQPPAERTRPAACQPAVNVHKQSYSYGIPHTNQKN